jgi:hypothetical protein
VNCGLVIPLFLVAVIGVAASQAAGIIAWRQRRPEFSARRWLYDPTYLYRARYYRDPAPRSRLVGMVLQVIAIAAVIYLGLGVFAADLAGAESFCGFLI